MDLKKCFFSVSVVTTLFSSSIAQAADSLERLVSFEEYCNSRSNEPDIGFIEKKLQIYFEAAELLYRNQRADQIPHLMSHFAGLVDIVVHQETRFRNNFRKEEILAKFFYEILTKFPDINFLDVLIKKELNILYKIKKKNDLKINTSISCNDPTPIERPLCRYATRQIMDLIETSQERSLTDSEVLRLRATKPFTLYLFQKLIESNEEKDINYACDIIKTSKSIPYVQKIDGEFNDIIDQIKNLKLLHHNQRKESLKGLQKIIRDYTEANDYETMLAEQK